MSHIAFIVLFIILTAVITQDLIGIYDKTVPRETLEILAELIALDGGQSAGPKTGTDDNIE